MWPYFLVPSQSDYRICVWVSRCSNCTLCLQGESGRPGRPGERGLPGLPVSKHIFFPFRICWKLSLKGAKPFEKLQCIRI